MNVNTAIREPEIVAKKIEAQEPWRKYLKIASQSVLALLIAICFLEGYFRLAGIGEQEFVQPDLRIGCRHIAGKKVIWRLEGYSADKLSGAGLRDTDHCVVKPPHTYRIALLGDSCVEALQVNMDDTFGKVLEKKLNDQLKNNKGPVWLANTTNSDRSKKIEKFEVINFGCSSYSTGQEVLQYEQEVDKYNPDAIVLLYTRGDALENVVKAEERKKAEARPYFYLDAGKLKEDDSVLLANTEKLKPDLVKDFLRKNSTIYAVLTQADFSLTLNEPRYCKLKNWWQAFLNLPNKIAGKKAIISKANYPDQDDLAVTEALLARLSADTKRSGRTFVLAIFPNIVDFDILKKQAEALKQLSEKEKFYYLDLSQSFLACNDPSSGFLQYHFSKKGDLIIANDLFNLFKRIVVN